MVDFFEFPCFRCTLTFPPSMYLPLFFLVLGDLVIRAITLPSIAMPGSERHESHPTPRNREAGCNDVKRHDYCILI